MMRRRALNPQTVLVFVCGLLLLSALLPLRFTRWLSGVRDPVMVLVAPVSTPMARVQSWLRPSPRLSSVASHDEIDQIRQERDRFRALYLAELGQNDNLRASIRALQAGMDADDSSRIRFLEARNAGYSPRAGSIDVSRGSAHGVHDGAVATARNAPQHLVGPVSRIGPAVTTVHLVTDDRLAPGLIEGLILSDDIVGPDQVRLAPRSQFTPAGDGTLEGDLSVDDAQQVKPGDLVFVDDPHWPLAAQHLILGRVVRVRDEPNRPLFKTVIIRPDIDLARVEGVILRIPREAPLVDAFRPNEEEAR